MKPTLIYPSGQCDICQDPLLDQRDSEADIKSQTYVDGKTKFGPWADMCETCFKLHGVGLGLGLGQRYNVYSGQKVEG